MVEDGCYGRLRAVQITIKKSTINNNTKPELNAITTLKIKS